MADSRRMLYGVLALAVIAILLAGFSVVSGLSKPTLPSTKRTIYMTAIEPKGSTTVDKEPFPTQALPLGGGYILKPPVDGKWEVSAYAWSPSIIVVYQGDQVTLQIIGINGALHASYIEGYVDKFEVKRGQLTTVEFTADKVGTFKIVCSTHQPNMVGYLIVLPRG